MSIINKLNQAWTDADKPDSEIQTYKDRQTIGIYLIVTIICGYYILRNFANWKKIAKLSTRKNFYQHIVSPHSHISCLSLFTNTSGTMAYYNHKLHGVFHFGTCTIILFSIVSAFSFLPFRAITSSRKWRLMILMIVGVSRAKLKLSSYRITGARCTVWHVSRNRRFEDDMYLHCQ